MDYLNQYKELLRVPTDPDTVKSLNQPERHVLLTFKVYKALLARIEELEGPTEALVEKIATARIADLATALEKELEQRLEQKLARNVRPLLRHGAVSALPAVPPRPGEPQG